MTIFKRTVSALALSAALAAGGAGLATLGLAPFAVAQDMMQTPEARLQSALDLQGLPAGVLKWTSVEEAGSGLIARGVYADVTQYNLGFATLPLGDLEVTDLQTDGTYVTRFKGRFTGMSVNLAELMTTGQAMGQAKGPDANTPNPAAQMGMMVAMGTGYIQGLGYSTLNMTIDFDNSVDLATGAGAFSGALDIADMFKFDMSGDMTGVDAAYLDWAKVYTAKMYSQSPEAQAEVKAAMADPNSPAAKVGFSSYRMTFADQGLMTKLEPQLGPVRQQMLGANPDGTPKTALTDEDLLAQAQAMAQPGGPSAEKLLPVMKAVYNFVISPKSISLGVKAEPAFTMSEFLSMQNPATAASTPIDWNTRVTFEASN